MYSSRMHIARQFTVSAGDWGVCLLRGGLKGEFAYREGLPIEEGGLYGPWHCGKADARGQNDR